MGRLFGGTVFRVLLFCVFFFRMRDGVIDRFCLGRLWRIYCVSRIRKRCVGYLVYSRFIIFSINMYYLRFGILLFCWV